MVEEEEEATLTILRMTVDLYFHCESVSFSLIDLLRSEYIFEWVISMACMDRVGFAWIGERYMPFFFFWGEYIGAKEVIDKEYGLKGVVYSKRIHELCTKIQLLYYPLIQMGVGVLPD